jgi:hypothetical protein
MELQLQKVLEKIIVPHYVEIEDVLVNSFGLTGDYIKVTYFVNQRVKGGTAVKIQEETVNLYKMVAPDGPGDIFVYFDDTLITHKD